MENIHNVGFGSEIITFIQEWWTVPVGLILIDQLWLKPISELKKKRQEKDK